MAGLAGEDTRALLSISPRLMHPSVATALSVAILTMSLKVEWRAEWSWIPQILRIDLDIPNCMKSPLDTVFACQLQKFSCLGAVSSSTASAVRVEKHVGHHTWSAPNLVASTPPSPCPSAYCCVGRTRSPGGLRTNFKMGTAFHCGRTAG